MKIYLGDLAYLQDNDSNQPVPLNVAYLATYVQKHVDGVEVEIFRDPRTLLDRIDAMPPDLLGLSHYDWNANLNMDVLRHCRKTSPKTFTVMGGPRFDYDDNEWISQFFRARPALDAYVAKEGEYSFTRLIEALMRHGPNVEDIANADLPSTIFLADHVNGKIINNPLSKPPIVELDSIPSPYLSGLLDPFLKDERLVPIIETNRGCPYACSFCCWGKVQPKINQFALERLEQEIDYICKRSKNRTGFFYIADANFGIFKRDIEIAKMFITAQKNYNYPGFMFVYFAKNTNEIVLNTAEKMKNLTLLSMSKQSNKPEVLESINRKNIPAHKHKELKEECERRGIKTFSEFIFGFPGETYSEFVQGVVEAVEEGHRPSIYWFLMLAGSESGTREYREKYQVETAFRIIPRYVSRYDEIHCLEYEEVITGNTTWSPKDFSKVRSFQFLTSLFGNRIFQFLNRYLSFHGYNYASFARDMLEDENNYPEEWRSFLHKFQEACAHELIAREDLKINFSAEDIDEVNRRKLSLIPNFMAQLATDPKSIGALKTYLEDFCGRIVSGSPDANTSELPDILDLTFQSIVAYDRFSEAPEVEWSYDYDAWLVDPAMRPLKAFARSTPKPMMYEFMPTIRDGLEELLAKGNSLADAVYILRVNIMGYSSEDVFCYKISPLKTREIPTQFPNSEERVLPFV